MLDRQSGTRHANVGIDSLGGGAADIIIIIVSLWVNTANTYEGGVDRWIKLHCENGGRGRKERVLGGERSGEGGGFLTLRDCL